jgi:hypothetical protein
VSVFYETLGDFGTDIGTGRKNTALILATDANAPAALACKNCTDGGKTDWFLPSSNELTELYLQRNLFGITTGTYWSSTQLNNISGSPRDFSGNSANSAKICTYNVRAIRAF